MARDKNSNGADPREPFVVQPNGVYRPSQLQAGLGLAPNTIPREIRLGRLRSVKRAGKRYVLGVWLLEWLNK